MQTIRTIGLDIAKSVFHTTGRAAPGRRVGRGRCALGTGRLEQGGDLPEAAP